MTSHLDEKKNRTRIFLCGLTLLALFLVITTRPNNITFFSICRCLNYINQHSCNCNNNHTIKHKNLKI